MGSNYWAPEEVILVSGNSSSACSCSTTLHSRRAFNFNLPRKYLSMLTIGKLLNKSFRLLSARSSPTSSSSSSLPPYQYSLVKHTVVEASSSRGLHLPPTFGVLIPNTLEVDTHHYICDLTTPGFEFDSTESVLQYFIKTFAKVLGGDEEEAKKKIYFVELNYYNFAFGAQIDKETCEKLGALFEIKFIVPDHWVDVRRNSNYVRSISDFSPINRNQRLHNMFNYQQSTACKNGENSGHWLINIKDPVGEDPVGGPRKVFNCCIELLAKVFGSEKAKERIYAVWCIEPFGFGAEMDVEFSKKLREQPNVLQVLPDCAFDIKDKEMLGVLVVCPSHGSEFIVDSTIMVDYVDGLFGCESLEDGETEDDEEIEDEDEQSK